MSKTLLTAREPRPEAPLRLTIERVPLGGFVVSGVPDFHEGGRPHTLGAYTSARDMIEALAFALDVPVTL